MRKSFGGTEVEIMGGAYRKQPTEYAPAGELGCDITLKIPNYEMTPVKIFLSNAISEDIAWSLGNYSQMIADDIVFTGLRSEFEKMKEKFNLH